MLQFKIGPTFPFETIYLHKTYSKGTKTTYIFTQMMVLFNFGSQNRMTPCVLMNTYKNTVIAYYSPLIHFKYAPVQKLGWIPA